jgi:large subunit ribosomal protein L35Ae
LVCPWNPQSFEKWSLLRVSLRVSTSRVCLWATSGAYRVIVNLIAPRKWTRLTWGILHSSYTNQHAHTALIKIQGLQDKDDVDFYLGKKIAYIYKGKSEKNGSKFRVIWGKVCRSHGNNGLVRAKFAKNLPAEGISNRVRIMLYPSRV